MSVSLLSFPRNRFALFLLLSALVFSCEVPKEEEPEESAKSTRLDVPEGSAFFLIEQRWSGDLAHRSVSYKLYITDDGFIYDGAAIPNDLVEAVANAANQDLIASDSIKSCREDDSNPVITMTFPASRGGVVVQTSSLCENWAPWNVIADGKLFVQLSGRLGHALPALLMVLEPSRWEGAPPLKSGRFELTKVGPLPEGAVVAPLLAGNLLELVKEDPGFKSRFPGKTIEELRVLCSQAQSADCSELLGRATVPYGKGETFDLLLDLKLDSLLGLQMPADDASLEEFLESKPYKTMKDLSQGNPIVLSYDAKGDCERLAYGAKEYLPEADASTLGCAFFTAILEYEGATLLPPKLTYYPALKAMRLTGWADKTDPDFFVRLKARTDIMEQVILERAYLFADLQGLITEIPK